MYERLGDSRVSTYIASTSASRKVLGDPRVVGVEYTNLMRQACSGALASLENAGLVRLSESECLVLHILRGGLNFGLREALSDAFGWNAHASAFISAQRARKSDDPEEWYITEGEYQKVYAPNEVSLVFGDVVATGTSLRYALRRVLLLMEEQNASLKEMLFFTIGGSRSEEILEEMDRECRERFSGYRGAALVYLEGEFTVAASDSSLRIREPGTDLLRRGALMAPEFIESQYEDPASPLERCVIYDAGSRAFWLPEYFRDFRGYWREVLSLAEAGLRFDEYLRERCPELDAGRFSADLDLRNICLRRLDGIQ